MAMMRDGVDSSLMLERSLFERDPEIEAVRQTPRFRAAFEKTFPDKDSPDRADKGRGR